MRWSKLKSLVEGRFAESMAQRVSINSTRYGACTCGHAWLTLDGKVVANFCTRAYFERLTLERDGQALPSSASKTYKGQYVTYGEISRQDLYEACWEYIHSLKPSEALKTADPLFQTLAVLDARIGKRTLTALAAQELHPLARHLWQARIAAEQIHIEEGRNA